MTTSSFMWECREGLFIRIHCQPRAKRTEVAGTFGESLKVRLKSPPVDGKANQEAQSLLADIFNVSRGDVTLVKGERSREKAFLILGMGKREALKILSDRGLL